MEFEEDHLSDDEMGNLDGEEGDEETDLNEVNEDQYYDDDELEALIAREEGSNAPQRSKRKPKTVKFRYGMSEHFFAYKCRDSLCD